MHDTRTRSQGAKLQYGRVPLYIPGDDPHAKAFRSLHAVQRHMVDTAQCKLRWEGNEDEYDDYYDYGGGAGAGGDEQEPRGGDGDGAPFCFRRVV